MKRLGLLLMKGLVAVLPLGLTAYSVYWLVTTTETLMQTFLLWFIRPEIYRPGMGLLVGVVFLLAVGTFVNAFVVVRLGDMRLLGFVTRDDLPELEAQAGGIDLVAVYLPMSYGIGGYTVYLPKDQCESLDMPVETAMRMALTAGMSSGPPPAR